MLKKNVSNLHEQIASIPSLIPKIRSIDELDNEIDNGII